MKVQLADRREDAESVACQENDVLRVWADARYLGVGDVLDRVSSARVLSDRFVGVINFTGVLIKDDILQHGPKLDGIPNIRLFLL